jgi:hypothetical protein
MWSLPVAHAAGQPGYSVNHAQYGTEREQWAKRAYAVPPAETISLEISAVRECGNRRKGSRSILIGVRSTINILLFFSLTKLEFQNICEGKKDIDACIDAPGLIALALDTVMPKIQAFAVGFPWRQNEFVIRDGEWVDLSTHPPSKPYFHSQCMHATRKGSRTMTFKSKQFILSVVVPMAQWESYETWLEKMEEVRTYRCHKPLPPHSTYTVTHFHRNSSVSVQTLDYSPHLQ